MILTIFIIYAVMWVLLALYMRSLALKTFKKYQSWPHDFQNQLDPKYESILRHDFGKWDESAILRSCWTSYPLHLMSMSGYLLGFGILATIKRYIWLPDVIVNKYRMWFGRIAFKICFDLQEHFNPW